MHARPSRWSAEGLLVLVLAAILACSSSAALGWLHVHRVVAGVAEAATRPVAGPTPFDPRLLVPAPAPTPPRASPLPGVGPATLAEVPASAKQVVLVTGAGRTADTSTVSTWRRVAGGWQQVSAGLPAHNGARGWSEQRSSGDRTSPLGVFTLTAAGGRLPDPGTKLPYEHDAALFRQTERSLLAKRPGSFDYVVAIDFNRVPGSPPTDGRLPLGAAPGGGIWFHVDHQSGTGACISLPLPDMQSLLRFLDPAQHPVVVMGDAQYLAR